MKYVIGIVLCLVLSMAAWADSPDAVRKRLELSMVITGTLDVAADGSVRSYTLDKEDKIRPDVVELVHRSAPGWRFKPDSSSDAADITRVKLTLRVVARRQSDGTYPPTLAGATFDDNRPGEAVTPREIVPPIFPLKARQGVGIPGTVYALLRVTPDGRVSDAAVEQVNLGIVGTDSELKERRSILAHSALAALKQWTFNIPTVGPHAAKDYWLVVVPVHFYLIRPEESSKDDYYGQWLTYVPGPKETISWLDPATDETNSSTDALANGQIHQVNGRLKLITPLSPT